MKKVGVLFSGGLDSTYLIWKNLMDGNQVTPIYIEIKNNTNKTILEKNRIDLLYNKFYENFGNNITDIKYIMDIYIDAFVNNLYFTQMPIWITGLIFSQGLCVDELQIGYIANDDIISYIDDIQKLYYSYKPFVNNIKPLRFPLLKSCKNDIFEELPLEYKKLIVSCEDPIILNENSMIIDYKPCGNCSSCKRIINSNYYMTGNFPDNYKEVVVMYHMDALQRIDIDIVKKMILQFESKNESIDNTNVSIKNSEIIN